MYTIHKNFATRQELHRLSTIINSVPAAQWRADNPNGKLLSWLPEREGFHNKTIANLAKRARLFIAKTPTSDGDVILLHYPEGGFIKKHRDVNMHGRHTRCGILIETPTMGGELFVGGACVQLEPGDAIVYDADKTEHWVNPVIAGERYLLTIGTIW